jgi:hypothetical protein
VSLDDITDSRYLNFLSGKPNALIISAFFENNKTFGELQNAVLKRLRTESPNDYVAVTDKFQDLQDFSAGQVLDIPLHIPENNYRRFSVDDLLVINLPMANGHPNPKYVETGLKEALNIADRKNFVNIVVPCLVARWNDTGENSLYLSEFFRIFFKSVPLAEKFDRIYLSLYYGWPTLQLESATRALNAAWQETMMRSTEGVKLYRVDFRLIMCFLEVCLIVCAFIVRFTFKNTLIIVVGFVGLAFGSKTWIDSIVEQESGMALLVKFAVLSVLALAFPIIVTWNPKDIFAQKADDFE